ncbi:MAG: TIR domain-containing protein [Chloroflexi bacterium]|nr:TIR domain-containing protein [Chloroflexota bacterium]
MSSIPRHKVFVSYHHQNDQGYRNRFERLFSDVYDIMDSRSVRIGSIPDGLRIDEISRLIRDDYLSDSTVTVVLIGTDTWRRKHIDWEVAATVRDTTANRRSGLVGIFLPTHPSYGDDDYDPYTIPPRLHYNVECGFADLYDWSESATDVAAWIHGAYSKRRTVNPDNGSVRFRKNWGGPRWYPQRRGG